MKKNNTSKGIYIDSEKIEKGIYDITIKDNAAMREAGCDLAEAAIRVIRDYDGVHRLSKAVARWCEVISEGGRKYK